MAGIVPRADRSANHRLACSPAASRRFAKIVGDGNNAAMQSSDRLDTLGKVSLALAALALGVVVGVIAAAPLQGSFAAPLARLYGLLLPVAGATLLIVVSLYSPLAALLLWLVLAPYSRLIPLDLSLGAGVPDLSLTRLMAGVMTLLVLIQAALGKRKLRRLTWADLAYAIFLAALFISVPRSEYDALFDVQNILDAYVVPFVALFVARQIVRDLRDLQWFTAALLITGVGFALLVIREQLTGEVLFFARETLSYSPSFRKVVSLMGNAAPMGLSTALTLPLGLVLTSQALVCSVPRWPQAAGAGSAGRGGRDRGAGRVHDLQPGKLAGGGHFGRGFGRVTATHAADALAGADWRRAAGVGLLAGRVAERGRQRAIVGR